MTGLLIRDCEVDDRRDVDVRVRDGVVVEIGPALVHDGEELLAAAGGALIPGLHDHHLHLFALAADMQSVRCGPDNLRGAGALSAALRDAARHGPVRGTGYFESVAGRLDRDVLDGFVPDVPVRVQHRSGALWFLNSAALAETALLDSPDPAVARDSTGRATGVLLRGDTLLRQRDDAPPDLADVGRLLASYGVIGVTDATPRLDVATVMAMHAAQDDGVLPQRLLLLGAPLEAARTVGVPWKIVVDEMSGLDPDGLVEEMRAAHAAGRPAAIHCTTRAETVLAVSALRVAKARLGDRLEHAGVLPQELDHELAQAGVTIVTQPHFIAERGEDYLVDVEPADHDLLYRCGSLIHAGVPVAAGTDAPYGRPDPWAAIAAAASRRTTSGVVVAASERLTTRRALDLFLGGALSPGGAPRRVAISATADLCLLSAPLAEALCDPRAELVAATVMGGQVVHRAD
jgi:predicted amidohydrolase YtcJ